MKKGGCLGAATKPTHLSGSCCTVSTYGREKMYDTCIRLGRRIMNCGLPVEASADTNRAYRSAHIMP